MRMLIIGALFCACTITQGMDETITLPDETTLQRYLEEEELGHFANHTTIIQELAGKTKNPVAVVMSVVSCLHHYSQKMPIEASIPLERQRPDIIKTILQGFPQAINNLEQQGFFSY
jgi:hypothetical protein